MKVNWEELWKETKRQDKTLKDVSLAVGKSHGFLYQARKQNSITPEAANAIVDYLGTDCFVNVPKETEELGFPMESDFEKYVRRELADIKAMLTVLVTELGASETEDDKREKAVESARAIIHKSLTSNGWAKYPDILGMCRTANDNADKELVDSVISEYVDDGFLSLKTTGYGENKTKWLCRERGDE